MIKILSTDLSHYGGDIKFANRVAVAPLQACKDIKIIPVKDKKGYDIRFQGVNFKVFLVEKENYSSIEISTAIFQDIEKQNKALSNLYKLINEPDKWKDNDEN